MVTGYLFDFIYHIRTAAYEDKSVFLIRAL